MAKIRRPQQSKSEPAHLCAWCANPLQDDYVTVTFPDKDQAVFHVECLYQYRAAMWPWAEK